MEEHTTRLIGRSLAQAMLDKEVDVEDGGAVMRYAIEMVAAATSSEARDMRFLDPASLLIGSVMAFASVELELEANGEMRP
jgi:hypothetical protein